ncbi:MAG: hypothetical protein EBU49_07490, partial [Proteobacteria bacterium]|nr:hypothetical protein [Pseudomonadota bacterium]
MKIPNLSFLRGISEIPCEALLVSLATHFTAILLGISAATVLGGDAWPTSALQLDEASVVFALPVQLTDTGAHSPGEKIKLVKSGVEPCAFQSKAVELLSIDPVVLISQSTSAASGNEIQAMIEWVSVAGNH